MSYQDWTEVKIGARAQKRSGTREQAANAARQAGQPVAVEQKFGASSNRSVHQTGRPAPKALAEDTETFAHAAVDHNISLNIQRGRTAKEWTQKDLAAAISERVQVVAEYESGKAIPNSKIISKIERALGVHVRGPKAGQPMEGPQRSAPAPKPAGKK